MKTVDIYEIGEEVYIKARIDDILIERMKHVCKKENQTVIKTKEE